MMSLRVSVICIVYNQAPYLLQAVRSVLQQDYPNTELILIDNGSSDGSPALCREIKAMHPQIEVILNPKNMGNCKAFNQAFRHSSGDLLIDLAGDDYLHPSRCSQAAQGLGKEKEDVGIQFCNVGFVDENNKALGYHFPINADGGAKHLPPEGELYSDLVARHIISSVSLAFRRSVFQQLGGYDESLAYEDFDFMVRAARHFLWAYYDQVLVYKRLHQTNMSRAQYKHKSNQLASTLRVCKKIKEMNRSALEEEALAERLRYESWMAARHGRKDLLREFLTFYRESGKNNWKKKFWLGLIQLRDRLH